MSDKQPQVAIFDAYGTLLDVDGPMRAQSGRLGSDWQRISAEWRAKHIEYTWVRTLAGPAHYRNFWELARESLEVIAKRHGISDQELLRGVLGGYRQLQPFPEVPDMLRALRAKGIGRAVLSNGEPAMLAEALQAGRIEPLLDDVLSADTVRAYKPDPRVYRLATDRFGLPAREIAFFSSNPWDAFGAREFGFRVFWVNRKGLPDEYGLRGSVTELPDLADIPLEQLARPA